MKTPTRLESIRRQYDVPALGTGLFANEMEIYEVVGFRKRGDSTAATQTDAFHLGSCTKAMTATLAATFIEQNKFSWNSTLGDLLPSLASQMNHQLKKVTFEQLMAHRSGLAENIEGDLWSQLWAINDVRAGRELVAKSVLSVSPEIVPNTEFRYSNTNYIIAGAILEHLTNKSWETLIQERLFKPLGMTSCGFGNAANADAPFPNAPWPHRQNGTPLTPNRSAENPITVGPAGTIHCSMQDWMKFLKIHINGYNGLDSAILKSASFKKLHTPYLGQNYTPGGWIYAQSGLAKGAVLTHDGSNTLNYASVVISLASARILLSVTNMGGDNSTNAVLDALETLPLK